MKFDAKTHRCSIIIDQDLPSGLAINAASVIGVGMGCNVTNLVGKDLESLNGVSYPGVIYTPLPILTSSQKYLHQVFEAVKDEEDIYVMPFSSLAQSCKTYDEYEDKMSSANNKEIQLVAVGLIGSKKKVTKIIGSLPLYK